MQIVAPLKKTVGQAAYELMSQPYYKQDAIETQREMLKGYHDELIKCVEAHKDWTEPFYVCVQTRRERTMNNVVRNQFYARKTRPAPNFDLALYYYDPKTEQLAFVWCIPDHASVEYICSHASSLPPEQGKLIEFCRSFKAGTLI